MNDLSASPKTVPSAPQIPAHNYISREFAEAEKANLWPRIWQVACREEEIPKAGDYIVYTILDESFIVVRDRDGTIRAHANVCPHRGRRLADDAGHTAQFQCRYHSWRFDLDGRNTYVQDQDDWEGGLCQDALHLHSVRVGTWGGFVFINMSDDPETLEDYLESTPQHLDPYEFETLRYRWYLELKLPCNWKTALEAFIEGYHIAGTHPQILPVVGTDYTWSKAEGKHSHFGTTKSEFPSGSPSPRLKRPKPDDARLGVVEFFRQMEEDLNAIATDRDYEAAKKIMDLLPSDTDAFTAIATAVSLGREAAIADGTHYPEFLTPAAMAATGSDWHIFPNCITLPYFDGAIFYRARPDGDDPHRCTFDIWSLKRYAEGKEPKLERRYVDDIAGESFGLIVDQDLANMAAVQQGMKSRFFQHAQPNPKQEIGLLNFHRVLKHYVAGN